MIKFLKKKLKKTLNNRNVGRFVDVLESDIFLVSYPKSGNTWLRFLIGNVLYRDYNFSNMEDLIPDIYAVNNKLLSQLNSPRIMKSHEYFDPRYKKVIYIVRDPRSVSVSYFFYLKKMKKLDRNISFDEYLDLFLEGHFDNYACWDENVNSWLYTRKENKNFLFVKYENLIERTIEELTKIFEFLEIEYTKGKLIKSIDKSSFKKMKQDELKNINKTKVLKNSNKEMPFVRKGDINEWKKYYSTINLNKIEIKFGATMKMLGYEI